MDEHVGSFCETSHALARRGVTADGHPHFVVTHDETNGGCDRVVINEHCVHCPRAAREDGGDRVRGVERLGHDDGSSAGGRWGLRVERLLVVRVETLLGVPR